MACYILAALRRIKRKPKVTFRDECKLRSQRVKCFKNCATHSVEQHGQRDKRGIPPNLNPNGVQLLSDGLNEQLFGTTDNTVHKEVIELSHKHLRVHNLDGKPTQQAPVVDIKTPPLQGLDLDEHFFRIGCRSAEPFLSLARSYAKSKIPPIPSSWIEKSGWTKYSAQETTEIDAPDDEVLTFDCEVILTESKFPVIATAVSPHSWYAWISPWLLKETENDRHLIPFGSKNHRLIVGHNIGFDRARIKEEYSISQSKNRFIDTMALHVAVNGMCTRQRPNWKKFIKQASEDDQTERTQVDAPDNFEGTDYYDDTSSDYFKSFMNQDDSDLECVIEEPWMKRSSVNSLEEVAKFHCHIHLEKDMQGEFFTQDRDFIKSSLQDVLNYNAADVKATFNVFSVVLPAFLKVAPHPVSFAGQLQMSSLFLPIDISWNSYLNGAEETYDQFVANAKTRLVELAELTVAKRFNKEEYEGDYWLHQLDWTGQEIRYVKQTKDGEQQMAKNQKLPGMPRWYRDLFKTANSSEMTLTIRSRIAPILLRLAWEGWPLVWIDKFGWTFRVDSEADAKTYREKQFPECDPTDITNYYMELVKKQQQTSTGNNKTESKMSGNIKQISSGIFFKMPHKDGPSARCASPFAKSYLKDFENISLSSEYLYALETLQDNAACSYWQSARARVKSQMVIWEDEVDMGMKLSDTIKRGMILPEVVPMGTITRRAVEKTWLTASNAKRNRIGSELKAMVKAPKGYKFVGADVDSEELWIASLIGDAGFGFHGATALGWMTLEGTKFNGTDLHSKTASILGISRDQAKIFNYGRIYGAGLKFAVQLLNQFNPTLSVEASTALCNNLYRATKGERVRTHKKMFGRRHAYWRGGTESFVFNILEEIADQEIPRTPVLDCAITEALMKCNVKESYITSRINWAIQSSGVDYLHLLIVSMDYLLNKYNIEARLCLTLHDEVRYLASEKDVYRAALALQISNLWTRAMFSQRLQVTSLPQSVAFFSAIDIDTVLRKEINMECVTPSHEESISPGKSLDIHELLSKMGKVEDVLGEPVLLDDDLHQYPYTPVSQIPMRKEPSYLAVQIHGSNSNPPPR